MLKYKKILVPYDGSDHAKKAVQQAKSMIPKDIPVEELYEVGSPGPVLLNMAEDNGIDLVVMGSRGLGPLKGIFMGSVSSYMVSRSKCPVLIVK